MPDDASKWTTHARVGIANYPKGRTRPDAHSTDPQLLPRRHEKRRLAAFKHAFALP
jgi:hypothetical protein